MSVVSVSPPVVQGEDGAAGDQARRPRRDAGLVQRLAEDVDAAFEEVVSTYQDTLCALVTSLSGDPGWSEEIVQDAFVRAYRALSKYDADRIRELALRPWLFRIAINVFRNGVRGKRVDQVLMAEPPEPGTREGGGGDPEHAAMVSFERGRLEAALRRLPNHFRTAIVLKYVHDLSYSDMAEVLDRPVGTVKAHLHRGMAMLRRQLDQEAA
jgi:RNA polymerase sigma-70 factor (ECF subfamily)